MRVRATLGWVAMTAAITLASACGSAGTSWKPTKPTQSIDANSFDTRYLPVISSLTTATTPAGFSWDATAPTQGLVDKFSICSWRLRESGTWAGNKGQLRDVRNILNRSLVQHHFHAAVWRDETGTPLLVSQDSEGALLEVTLGHPATIDIYSPAAGGSCPSS